MKPYKIRIATSSDAEKIALLHASSWKKAYRGLLSDVYLDNDLEGERKTTWLPKMAGLTSKEFVLLAEDEQELIGFVAVLDKPENSLDAFIDNLHVRWDLKGQGVGKQLMKAVAEKLLESNRKSVYLFVLKGNDAAEKFYLARGARRGETSTIQFGGKIVEHVRFEWPSLDALLKA
jgi:ribosomal protein S18 acetylase RimI-like enzyme